MPSCKISPPWSFLLSASKNSLQSYELSRLSHAANLRKEIAALVDQWVEENSSAMLARWLMENHDRDSAQPAERSSGGVQPAAAGISASHNFLGDFAPERAYSHGKT
jgi:hypothetical protein